jgi:hypothetical protein
LNRLFLLIGILFHHGIAHLVGVVADEQVGEPRKVVPQIFGHLCASNVFVAFVRTVVDELVEKDFQETKVMAVGHLWAWEQCLFFKICLGEKWRKQVDSLTHNSAMYLIPQ